MVMSRRQPRVAAAFRKPVPAATPSPEAPPQAGRAMSRVLMIDNASLFQVLEKSFLRRGGCDIVRAGDGREVVALARAHVPDLILLETDRCGADGPRCIEALKADPALAGIPVLAVCPAEEAARCAAAGAETTLALPLDPAGLESALCALGGIAHREGRRAFAGVAVRVGSPEGSLRGRLTDLSRTGLFLALARPLPLQAPVDLSWTLPAPGGRRSVRAHGVVVRQVLPDRSSHLVSGVGVRFVDLDAASGSTIDAYLSLREPGAPPPEPRSRPADGGM